MTKPYRKDLAYIHDVGHGEFVRRAAPGLLKLLRRRGIRSGLVIDLGCGSGIWAEQLLQAGYEVLGIDISPAMIALAKERAPQAKFRCESFFQSEFPPCAAVTSISECFNYLFDKPTNRRSTLARMFRNIYRALQPGGVLVFDVLEPALLDRNDPPKRFRQGNDWAVLVEVETDRRCEQITRNITSFRRVGKLFRRDQESHRVQLLSGDDLSKQLSSLGFHVTALPGYGDMKLPPGHTARLAVKPNMSLRK